MAVKKGSKRQHYFPQGVQRNFLAKGEGRLWVYDRATDMFRHQLPSEIAAENHLYTFRDPALEEQRFALEEAFAKLDDEAAIAFRKLREGQRLTQREHNIVSEYVAFQFFRTPENLTVTKEFLGLTGQYGVEESALMLANLPPEKFKAKMQEYAEKSGSDFSDVTQQEIRDTVEEGRLTVRQPVDAHLGLIVDSATELAIILSRRRWLVAHTASTKLSYVGSDCPVLQKHTLHHKMEDGIGAGSSNTVNVFPFSRDAALVILDNDGGTVEHVRTRPAFVKSVNNQSARVSARVIFSHSKALLKSLARRNELATTGTLIAYDKDLIRENIRDLLQKSEI